MRAKIKTERGQANSTGFKIQAYGIEVRSANYLSEDDKWHERYMAKKFVLYWFILNFIFLAVHCCLFFKINIVRFLLSMFLLFIVVTFVAVVITGFVHGKRSLQWHACEHKAGNLLDSNLDLTLDNMRKTSRFHSRCGTQRVSVVMLFLLGEYLLLSLTKLSILSVLMWSPWFLVIYVVACSFDFQLPPSPLQYLTTRNPNEEQLEEALRVAQEIMEKFQ